MTLNDLEKIKMTFTSLKTLESLESLKLNESLDLNDQLLKKNKTRNKNKPNKKNKVKDTTLQDVFGDYMCGVFQDMQEYWSQFGFIDTKQERCVLDLLDIVKSTISVKPLVLDDDDGYIEDEIVV